MDGRQRLLAVAAAAAASVVAVGIGWVVAGGGSGAAAPPGTDQPGVVAAEATSRASAPPPGTAPVSPGRLGESEGPAGPGTSGGTGAGGPGSGAGGSGGGESSAGNRPPVIEDVDLSSRGLILFVAPTVSDPDGDDLSLRFQVDGDPVDPTATCYQSPTCKGEEDPAMTPTKAAVRLDHAEVGYRHEASVIIVATDDHGATSREAFTHPMEAVAQVFFRPLRFTVARPADCFRDQPSRMLSFALDLSGAGTDHVSGSRIVISEANASLQLAGGQRYEFAGQEAPPLAVKLRASFAGTTSGFAAPRTYQRTEDVRVRLFTGDCEAHFSYRVEFTVS